MAKSLKYILDYNEEGALEEILCRTFTIDMIQYGDTVTFDLVPNGKEIYVTKENRRDFVDKYIEYLFEKQCEKQIAAFKRGFFKFFEPEMLRFMYNPVELE